MPGLDLTLTQTLTTAMRTSSTSNGAALRRALVSAGFDPDQVAIADLCPTSAGLGEDGTEIAAMWVVMATADGSAYVGHLLSTDASERFGRLVEVPARPLPEAARLAEQLNENRRRRLPWDTGLPDGLTSPDDVLSNGLIQNAVAYLAGER